MNWTEGSLVRHSRGRHRNALIARQKRHFAKARSTILNGGTKQGPISISFLPSEPVLEPPRRAPSTWDRYDAPSIPLSSAKQEFRQEPQSYMSENGCENRPINYDRRKRLLEKSDWAGLGLQKPLDISFPGQIYATKRWTRAPRSPETVPDGIRKPVAIYGEEHQKRTKKAPLRIRIGSQDIRPSVATSSRPDTELYSPKQRMASHGSRNMHLSERGGFGHTILTLGDVPRELSISSARPETPTKVVYSSSVICEPAPRRNNNFQVLQWSPSKSEDRGSMSVETGRSVQPIPSSQESEQQRWKDWVLCEDPATFPSNSPSAVIPTSEMCDGDSGSSDLTLPSHLQPRLPSLHLSSEVNLKPGHDLPKHITIETNTRRHVTPKNNQSSPKTRNLLPSKQNVPFLGNSHHSDDLNDTWMKFACGDDEDSDKLLTNAFKQAAHQAAVELKPSNTSDSVDGQTAAATCGTEMLSSDHQYEYDWAHPSSSQQIHVTTSVTASSEAMSSNIAIAGSSDKPSHNPTRFVMPKGFVGKRIGIKTAPTTYSSRPHVTTGGNKGRGKKRRKMAIDGRTDIRNLPDYDGDPIEEIEDD